MFPVIEQLKLKNGEEIKSKLMSGPEKKSEKIREFRRDLNSLKEQLLFFEDSKTRLKHGAIYMVFFKNA